MQRAGSPFSIILIAAMLVGIHLFFLRSDKKIFCLCNFCLFCFNNGLENEMKRFFNVFSISMLIFGALSAAGTDTLKVACVGNSITYGAGVSNRSEDAFPGQLQKLLGQDYVVGNFGNSGRTMLKHGDFHLWVEPEFKAAIEMQPDIVVIFLGANDTKPWNWDDYKDEFVPDYTAMIDTFRSVNPATHIYACLPPPAFSVQWGIRDSIITTDVIPMIRQLARSTGVDTIDFYTPLINSNALFPDDIHPNVDGSWEMAKIIYKKLTGDTVAVLQDIDLARGKPVSADSWDNCSTPEVLVDGDRSTRWSCMSAGNAVVDLEQVESIDMFQTDFDPAGKDEGQRYTIETSVDSVVWTMAVDKSDPGDSSVVIAIDAIEPIEARYVRLTPMGPVNAVAEAVGANDFRVLRTAPAHNPTLSWELISISSRYAKVNVYVTPTTNENAYYRLFTKTKPESPMTSSKGYRPIESYLQKSTVRPDGLLWVTARVFKDGDEECSTEKIKIDKTGAAKSDAGTELPQPLQSGDYNPV